MVEGARAKPPQKFPFMFFDAQIIDAGEPNLHEPVGIERPVFVSK
jgi:hypothetical protein